MPTVSADASIQEILKLTAAAAEERAAAAAAAAAALAAAPAAAADVDALEQAFGVPRALAERVLRLAGGDVRAAARGLVGRA